MSTRTFYPEDSYSYQDLNRVSSNIINLETKIRELDYPVPPSEALYTWSITDLGLIARINILRARINRLYQVFYKPPAAPEIYENPANIQVFDFKDANDLEVALELLDKLANSLTDNYKYCGTFTTGEGDVI